jgi:hypothetical protein
VALYNRLGSQGRPEIGELVVEGDFCSPSAVMFVASHPVASGIEIRSRAFPLRGIPEKEWGKLLNVAESEQIRV